MSAGFAICTSPQFDFRATIFSHGWLQLAPFRWDEARAELEYTVQTAASDVLRIRLSAGKDALCVSLPDVSRNSGALEKALRQIVIEMLNLDWDLRPFYAAMREFDGRDWIEKERRGRILKSPTLWEDLAKVLLTTNTSWAQTVAMCRRLCELGTPHPTAPGCHAFPTPELIASMDFDAFAADLRAGYRNAWLHELAGAVASGAVDLDAWRRLDSDDLYQAVKSLKGFGDYAAGTIARLYGHFDKLAIDSACRDMFARKRNGGAKADDAAIRERYAHYGKWQGLVMWLDVMRR